MRRRVAGLGLGVLFLVLAAAPVVIGIALRPAAQPAPPQLQTVTVQQLAKDGLEVEPPVDEQIPGWVQVGLDHGLPRSFFGPFIEERPAHAGVPVATALAASGARSSDYHPVESALAYVTDTRATLGPGCLPGQRFCRERAPIGDRVLCYLVVTDHLRDDGTVQRLVMVVDAHDGRLLTEVVA